jgi:hypothetical protein
MIHRFPVSAVSLRKASRRLRGALAAAALGLLLGAGPLAAQVKVTEGVDAVSVEMNGQPFTNFVFKGVMR